MEYKVNDIKLVASTFIPFVNQIWKGDYDIERTQAALSKTLNITAYDNKILVGCLRILTDGYFFGTITELLVLPEYQKQGVGSKLLELAKENTPTMRTAGCRSILRKKRLSNKPTILHNRKTKGTYNGITATLAVAPPSRKSRNGLPAFLMPEIRKEIFDMTDIEEKIAKAEEEIRQLQNRKRKLLNQKKDAERKARTHRLIERGAILESLLEKPEQYSNEQIKDVLEIAFQTAQAQEHLRKIGEENGEN